MDPEKLAKWLEMAKQFSGNDFWSDIFGQPEAVPAGRPVQPDMQNHAVPSGPAVDVRRSDEDILVLVDLPGVAKEDVQLALSGGQLMIKGVVKPPFPMTEAVSTERFHGPFLRRVRLPEPVQDDVDISATFRDGLLTVRIPLWPDQTRSIPIE